MAWLTLEARAWSHGVHAHHRPTRAHHHAAPRHHHACTWYTAPQIEHGITIMTDAWAWLVTADPHMHCCTSITVHPPLSVLGEHAGLQMLGNQALCCVNRRTIKHKLCVSKAHTYLQASCQAACRRGCQGLACPACLAFQASQGHPCQLHARGQHHEGAHHHRL